MASGRRSSQPSLKTPTSLMLTSTVPPSKLISMRQALKKNGDQALGRSRGGLTTKLHTLTEARGNPVRFLLTGGNSHDCPQASRLIHGISAENFMMDKAYDSDAVCKQIEAQGGQAVIPSKSNRKLQRVIDTEAYKRRNIIERFFCRIKQFRRIATRYDKLAMRYASFVLIASALVWGTWG